MAFALVRVQVVQLVDIGEVPHVFQVPVGDHAGIEHAELLPIARGSDRFARGAKERLAVRAFRRGKAQQAGERHRQIQAIGNQVVIDLRFDAGPGQDQRHAHDVLIQGAVLIEHAVVAAHIPVVAGEDDERIPQIDVPQNAANRVVNLRNHAIIARDLARHFRPGHGLQVPVPGLLLVREGLVFECIVPAGPFGDGGGIVHAGKRRARAAGQMRHTDVHKQMPGAGLRADKLDGAVRQPVGFG